MPGTVAFIFDDGYSSLYSMVAPAFEARGLRAGFAVGSKLRFSGMSELQFLELQDRGHEVLNHGRTHQNLSSVNTPHSLAYDEIAVSQEELQSFGLKIDSFVAANSALAEPHIVNILEKTHFSGYTIYAGDESGLDALQSQPLDRYRMKRTNLFLSGVSGAISAIDAAIATNGLLIFYDHDPARTDYANSMSITELEQVLDYIVESGISVKLPTKAIADIYPEAYEEYIRKRQESAMPKPALINYIPDPTMQNVSSSGIWKVTNSALGSATVSSSTEGGFQFSRTIFLRGVKPRSGAGAVAFRNAALSFTSRSQRLGPVCFSVELSSPSADVNNNFDTSLWIYVRNTSGQIVSQQTSNKLFIDSFSRRYSVSLAQPASSSNLTIECLLVASPKNINGANADIVFSSPRIERSIRPT